MDSRKPLRKEGVLPRQVGEEWMLFDSTTEAVHVINKAAEFVWRFCDGSHNLDDIKQEMLDTYNVSDERGLQNDLDEIIAEFENLKIITLA